MPGATQVPARRGCVFAYGTVTLCGVPSQTLPLTHLCRRQDQEPLESWSYNPRNATPPGLHATGLGSSLFARHYSGNRFFFPFLPVLRCFSSRAYLPLPYVFRQGYPCASQRTGGFPHSEIPGSKLAQQLPEAYRSRPRLSSAVGAKASTVYS